MSMSKIKSYVYDDNRKVTYVPYSRCRYTDDPRQAQRQERQIQERWLKIKHRVIKHRCDIESGLVDPNPVMEDGTPLHYICKRSYAKDDVDSARSLFSPSSEKYQPVEIDARDNFGRTALYLAVHNYLERITEFLLSRGANPNLANDKGETPLHVICGQSHIFDPYHPGTLARQLAQRQERIVELLLRRGADPGVADAAGSTPLHLICYQRLYADKLQLAETLFEFADERYRPLPVDARDGEGDTPLHLAVDKGYNEMVDFLLRRSANPNLANDEGETPLHIICRRGKSLINFICGVRVAVDGELLATLFTICGERQLQVRVDVKDRQGRTPLQWAVANFNLDAIDVLLDGGADLSSFVFPVEPDFYERFRRHVGGGFFSEMRLASGIMMVVEHLESKGYELELSDALTIMTFFVNHWLIEETPAIEKCLNSEQFAYQAKREMIKPDLPLYDLIQLRPEEAAKRLTYADYYKFARSSGFGLYWNCYGHLCEKLSREFFRRWALQPFQKLIHYRLPEEMCVLVIEALTNKDLFHICLAAQGQTIKEGKIYAML